MKLFSRDSRLGGLIFIVFMPFIGLAQKTVECTLFWQFGDAWAVRKGPWKLSGQAENILSLVNVEKDITEQTNLLSEQPELSNELMKLHRQWMVEVGNR